MRRFMWESGGILDPTDYLKWLALHGDALPPGARSYARHPSHFDYYAFRVGEEPLGPGTPLCPKDLLLHRVSWSGEQDTVELKLMFPGYDPETVGTFDLTIVYNDVERFHLDHRLNAPKRMPIQLGGLMADEVATGSVGVVHYLDFECGTVTVACADMTGIWR
jgi:hypothetical protein